MIHFLRWAFRREAPRLSAPSGSIPPQCPAKKVDHCPTFSYRHHLGAAEPHYPNTIRFWAKHGREFQGVADSMAGEPTLRSLFPEGLGTRMVARFLTKDRMLASMGIIRTVNPLVVSFP